jgi:hypothetical protein
MCVDLSDLFLSQNDVMMLSVSDSHIQALGRKIPTQTQLQADAHNFAPGLPSRPP